MKQHSLRLHPLYVFLLYVSVMFIITFLQQECFLLPELESMDFSGEKAKLDILEKWQKWRGLSYLIIPFFLILRLFLVSLCLFVGSFLFSEMSYKKFKDWWEIALFAQVVMLCYSVITCLISLLGETRQQLEILKYSSLLFLGRDNLEKWLTIPLSATNIFEIAYWFVMAKLVSLKTNTSFGKSFKFVMSSYGVGYLFYIVLLMFLVLYLN